MIVDHKINVLKILSWLFKSLVFALLFAVLLGLALGFKVFLVNGASAEPAILYKSLIITYKPAFDDLQIGDFVTYSSTGTSFVTHRIIDIDAENQSVTTQGYQGSFDQPNGNSELVEYTNIYGRVCGQSYVAGVLLFSFRSTTNIILAIMLIAIIYIYKEFFTVKIEYW